MLERLRSGLEPERALLRQELELPQALASHLDSSHCREVIIALAREDGQVRRELLEQLKMDLGVVLEVEGGRQFVEQMLRE